jgi:hypothetical protein
MDFACLSANTPGPSPPVSLFTTWRMLVCAIQFLEYFIGKGYHIGF